MSSIEELFDDNQKMGSILILVAFITAVLAILGIILAFFIENWNIGFFVASALGTLIASFLLFQYGEKVRDGPNDKLAIFSGLVRLSGIVMIVMAVFNAIGAAIWGIIGYAIGMAVFMIIIGLILIWAAAEIEKATQNHDFMWILLAILFALATLIGLFTLIMGLVGLDIVTVGRGLCTLLLGGYSLYLALSKEVRTAMGA